jgi:WD40 repeat protein
MSTASGLVVQSQRGVASGGPPTSIELREQPASVALLAISPGGDLLAAGSEDGEIRLWRLPPGADIATVKDQAPQILAGHRKKVRALVFDSSGRKLASASDDGTARLWLPGASPTETASLDLHGHIDPVRSLSFAPSGDFLASLSEDKNVRVWHLPPPAQLLAGARTLGPPGQK